ncbi:hypothetical protein CN404_30780 [Bacillus thuringiensis]|uniref:hypothetical protein n=1 Tax=Bacillus thuringiensis TaxID=1428 RepID=UPI000BF86D89|nr:hypothetical protein [Bacillus thuringiensis]PFB39324.1 hypothetical protein CN404_30780 [Bacillus thuringiensis]
MGKVVVITGGAKNLGGLLSKMYAYIHQSRGGKSKLSLEEMLFVTLKYLRQYPTMKEIRKGVLLQSLKKHKLVYKI